MMSLIRKTNMKIIATVGYIDSNNIGRKMMVRGLLHDIESLTKATVITVNINSVKQARKLTS